HGSVDDEDALLQQLRNRGHLTPQSSRGLAGGPAGMTHGTWPRRASGMANGHRVAVRALDVADVVDGDAVRARADRSRKHAADPGALRIGSEAAPGRGRLADAEANRDRRLGLERGQRRVDVAG